MLGEDGTEIARFIWIDKEKGLGRWESVQFKSLCVDKDNMSNYQGIHEEYDDMF